MKNSMCNALWTWILLHHITYQSARGWEALCNTCTHMLKLTGTGFQYRSNVAFHLMPGCGALTGGHAKWSASLSEPFYCCLTTEGHPPQLTLFTSTRKQQCISLVQSKSDR